jgi:hypothetical protein
VRFDEDGVCNYCRSIEEMDCLYPTGDEGRQRLSSIADAIRKEGKGKQYDLILGVSGGCDSSY